MTYIPRTNPEKYILVASECVSRALYGEAMSSISYLAVNRILPMNSKVFQVVHSGQVQELRELFKSGEASLRDHDENGGSLLFVSLHRNE